MNQTQFDYVLADDSGSHTEYDVAILVPVGGTFRHWLGTYRVEEHHRREDGETVVICERIATPQ